MRDPVAAGMVTWSLLQAYDVAAADDESSTESPTQKGITLLVLIARKGIVFWDTFTPEEMLVQLAAFLTDAV